MDHKGQSAIEYLLLIGGALLIAAVLIGVITGIGGLGKNQANTSYQKINEIQLCLQQSDCPTGQSCLNGKCA